MNILTEKTVKIIETLVPEGNLDFKLKKILENEIRKKLTEFKIIDRKFQEKYGMTLDEFEKREIIKKNNFSFEVESDYQDWDSAVDAIKTLEKNLQEIYEQ